jgi:hypothetical protein
MARAAVLLAAAILAGGAGAASAQKSGLGAGMVRSGPAFSSSGHRVGAFFGGGFARGGFRHRRRSRFRDGAFGYGGIAGYGGYDPGYAPDDPEDLGRDSGFFYGEGDVRPSGGEALYSYDRSYPYDWYRGPAARPPARRLAMREAGPREVHCGLEHSVRVCRGD